MNKLFIITILALFLLTACTGGKTLNPSSQTGPAVIESSQGTSIGVVDEGPNTVDLTLPSIIFGMATGEENLSPDTDLADYIKRNRFSAAKWNADHSLTVTMTKERYAGYKADMAIPVEEIIDGILTYPYVEGIEKEEDYKTVAFIVNGAILEEDGIASADGLNTFYTIPMLGSYTNVYRMFVGLDNEFSVIIKDSETGTKLGGIDYPLI